MDACSIYIYIYTDPFYPNIHTYTHTHTHTLFTTILEGMRVSFWLFRHKWMRGPSSAPPPPILSMSLSFTGSAAVGGTDKLWEREKERESLEASAAEAWGIFFFFFFFFFNTHARAPGSACGYLLSDQRMYTYIQVANRTSIPAK